MPHPTSTFLVRKGKIKTRSQQKIIGLLAYRRIRDINVAERILPSQPLVDLGDGPQIKRRAVLAGFIQIREVVTLLGQHRRSAQLLRQFFTECQRNQIPVQVDIIFPGVVDAAKQVEGRFVIRDDVVSEAAAEDRAEVEGL